MVVTRRFTATVSGSTWKPQRCDRCQTQFAYQMTRESTGQGVSPYMLDDHGAQQRASAAAQRSLEHALTNAKDDVPCPRCLSYSADATLRLKKAKFGWMFVLGMLGLLGTLTMSPSLLAPELSVAPVIGTLVVVLGGSVALLVARAKLMGNYDPNSDELRTDRQTALGKKKTMLRADYEAMVQVARAQGVDDDELVHIAWT